MVDMMIPAWEDVTCDIGAALGSVVPSVKCIMMLFGTKNTNKASVWKPIRNTV